MKKLQAYISKIERGERGVDAVELAEFAKIYGKSLEYFTVDKNSEERHVQYFPFSHCRGGAISDIIKIVVEN